MSVQFSIAIEAAELRRSPISEFLNMSHTSACPSCLKDGVFPVIIKRQHRRPYSRGIIALRTAKAGTCLSIERMGVLFRWRCHCHCWERRSTRRIFLFGVWRNQVAIELQGRVCSAYDAVGLSWFYMFYRRKADGDA